MMQVTRNDKSSDSGFRRTTEEESHMAASSSRSSDDDSDHPFRFIFSNPRGTIFLHFFHDFISTMTGKEERKQRVA